MKMMTSKPSIEGFSRHINREKQMNENSPLSELALSASTGHSPLKIDNFLPQKPFRKK